MEKLRNLCRCRLPGVEGLIGFLLPLVDPVLGVHRLLLLIKYLRCRGHILNVFRLGYAIGSALGAALLAVRLPGTGLRIPFRNLNFPNGNSLRRNGIMRFLLANCAFFRACAGVSGVQEFGSAEWR
jgi:hypothetical protein